MKRNKEEKSPVSHM